MFQNYLVTALRNFTRHKLYSFINIAGLAVALACATFIILFVRDELSYDSWIPDSQNLYRVESVSTIPGDPMDQSSWVAYPVGPALQAQIPEIQAQTRLTPLQMTAKTGDRLFLEMIDVADPNFFQIIKLPFVEGDPATALARPESVVLSQTAARKYFGRADPLGKTIVLYDLYPVTVTGVLRDLPHNTQLIINMMIPATSIANPVPRLDAQTHSHATENWLHINNYAYVKLAPGVDPRTVAAKTISLIDKNVDARKHLDLALRGSQVLQLRLTRFWDVHLNPGGSGPDVTETASGSWTIIYGFSTIAVLILLIACFNFTNLATARATMRIREVGLRKVVGATRKQLIVQFLGESVLTALIAAVLSLAVVEVLLPLYDGFLGRSIAFHYIADWPLTLGIVLVAAFCGLLGGLYPAFVLVRFRPAVTLKAGVSGQGGSGLLRSVLVVLQFAVSIALGIAAIVVFAQINYAHRLDLGFDRDNLVAIARYQILSDSAGESLMQKLRGSPDITDVAPSGEIPFSGASSLGMVEVPGTPEKYAVLWNMVGPTFSHTYGMNLLAGRNLSLARSLDTNNGATGDGIEDGRHILINAAAARRFGFGVAGAVGRTIMAGVSKGKAKLTIVGVFGDAKFDGVGMPVSPTIYYYNPHKTNWFTVRIKAGRTREALQFIDRTWHEFLPTRPIVRYFLNDNFDKLFAADEKEDAIFSIFVAIAIFIACLGLFGLAALTAERRTKEIGIRKICGARTVDIVGLLVWQFSIPVLIANLIAWPAAWYYLHNWLESYAYRISLSPLYFVAAGAVALVIAWATVIAHAIRVARANPVHALRYE